MDILNDEIVLKMLSDKNGNLASSRVSKQFLEKHPDLKFFLDTRFSDFDCYGEVFYRLKFGIEERPVCKICRGRVIYLGEKKGGFQKHCCDHCAKIDSDCQDKHKQTCLEKYGVAHQFMSEQVRNKSKKTMTDRYGVEVPLKSEEIKQKMKETCLEKYGVQNGGGTVEALEKIKKTINEKYGVDSYFKAEGFREKRKKTMIDRYGVEYPMQDSQLCQKIAETCVEKYGFEHAAQNKEIKEKTRQTCLNKYGVDCMFKTEKCIQNAHTEEAHRKSIESKKRNKTINSSKIEQYTIDFLNKAQIKYEYQYRSEKYPFNCDFYFPDFDTYLEIQGSWVHGNHPYDKNNSDDAKVLQVWRHKAEKSDFYKNAIQVWTVADVKKREIARKNGLNLVEIFSCDFNAIDETINKILKIAYGESRNK